MKQGQSQEDYLREIYALSEESADGSVSSVDVAERLLVSKAAVSKMLKKLNEEGLVRMSPYSRMEFSKKGRIRAEKVIYKHRVIEVFLVEVLKVDKRDMHKEAHLLEHSFSDKTIKRLAEFLDNPEICPCGHKIPKIR